MFALALVTNYPVVSKLTAGTKVSVFRYEGEWAYIQSGTITGYVNNYYLASPSTNTGNKIAIDPGHGGTDPGAIANGIYEKELNLDVALRVEKLLQAKRDRSGDDTKRQISILH